MNELFKKRMNFAHQNAQNRMIQNKKLVLKDSITHSYFGFDVIKPEENDRIKYRVLITRDDEDEQIISSFFKIKRIRIVAF